MKEKKIPFQKQLWCRIRMYQHLHDIPNERLADVMDVGERTLREYDKQADHITLEKIDRVLGYFGVTIEELIAL